MVLKGGLSDGYKNYISEKELPDETYREDGTALFRVQGSGPDNMQAIQVEAVASSLNSSYCYILHRDTSIFTWIGNLTTTEDQELVERQLDIIKPNMQSRHLKEGSESEQFWEILGGKSEYSRQKIARDSENDPHLFSCTMSKGELKLSEVYNFNQDDLMTEDVYILDCHSSIFVWVGQQVDSKTKTQALDIGQKFLELDFLLEKISLEAPMFVMMEGNEPQFFTRFFTWDSTKSTMHGNSFERRLSLIKDGGRSVMNTKPKRGRSLVLGGRAGASPKPQRSRSVSFSSDRPRARGRSPAFNALASTFENPSARNLSTPPTLVRKLYPKAASPDTSSKLASRAHAIASLTASFDKPTKESLMPRSLKVRPDTAAKSQSNNTEKSMSSRIEALTIKEDVKENEAEDEEGLTLYPYERLTTSSKDPAPDIDLTKREMYLSSAEFREKFGMNKDAFYKLPKWKQNKMKVTLQLF